MRQTAFGISVPETDPAVLEAQAHEQGLARRQLAARVAARTGNRHHRRHPFAGFPGTRRPITSAEKAHRKARRAMARASRKANR